MIQDSPLLKLTRLCTSVASDKSILEELKGEIENNGENVIISMLKQSLNQTNLEGIGMIDQVLPLCFQSNTITEIELFGTDVMGIKCFFMSKGTYFPLHDHPNEVVVTVVLHGSVRYLVLDKLDNGKMKFAKKGTGKPGKAMFHTMKFRNVHSIYAEEDSVILDIFMHNVDEPGNFYKVLKFDKGKKEFLVEKNNHVFFLTRSWKMMNCDCGNR